MKKLLIIFAAVLVMISCGGGKKISKGMTVNMNQKCIGAYDEESFKKMTDYCVAEDERGLELMDAAGLIEILYNGTTGKVTETGFGKCKIRLFSNDREIWVANEFVDPLE